jgi:hypothetical protein
VASVKLSATSGSIAAFITKTIGGERNPRLQIHGNNGTKLVVKSCHWEDTFRIGDRG